GQRRPPERALALAEHRAAERGDEPRIVEGALEPPLLGPGAQVVPVVEDHRSAVEESDHGLAVAGHRAIRALDVVVWIALAQRLRVLHREAGRDVATQGIVRARLVGDDVRREPATEQLWEHLRRVAEEADGERLALRLRPLGPPDGLVDVFGLAIEVPGLDPSSDPCRVDLDA